MTATDELRKLLEEHGIKHFDYDKGGRTQTQWAAPDGTRHFTYETYNNPSKTAKLVISWFPTPEQAIAATLGRGTCHDQAAPDAKRFCCSICCTTDAQKNPLFCHGCGRKVDA